MPTALSPGALHGADLGSSRTGTLRVLGSSQEIVGLREQVPVRRRATLALEARGERRRRLIHGLR